MSHGNVCRKRILITPDPDTAFDGANHHQTSSMHSMPNEGATTDNQITQGTQPRRQPMQGTPRPNGRWLSVSSKETSRYNSESEWNQQSEAYLSFDPTPAVRSNVQEACMQLFKHEGESKFAYESTPAVLGNVLPTPPVMGEHVLISIRIADNSGKLAVFADKFGFNFPSGTQSVRGAEFNTIGTLLDSDLHYRDLSAICAIGTHSVEGDVVSIDDADPVLFTVRWMCSVDSTCTRV